MNKIKECCSVGTIDFFVMNKQEGMSVHFWHFTFVSYLFIQYADACNMSDTRPKLHVDPPTPKSPPQI